jgi:hypothetical protein
MAEPDRQQLLTALTTEHFGLAGARAQVTGESSALETALMYMAARVGTFTNAPLGICAGVGGVVAIISLVRLLRIEPDVPRDGRLQ